MRARLVTPMTISTRQMTTMKYGFRIEKRDMSSLGLPSLLALILEHLDRLRAARPGPAFRPLRSLTTTWSPSFRPEMTSASLAVCMPRVILRSSILFAGLTTYTVVCSPSWFTACSGTDSASRLRSSVRVASAYSPGISTWSRLDTSTSVCMVRVSSFTSTEKRVTLPGKAPVQRGHRHLDGIADVNVADVGLRHRNHQAEQIVLREPDQRHGLRAGTGAGLHQRAEIGVALRDHAGEGRRDLGVIEQNLVVLLLGLAACELALAASRLDFVASTCASAARSLPCESSTSCCATRPGFDLATLFKPIELQMEHLVLRFHAPEFVLGVRHLVGRVPDGGVILLQLDLQFGDLEHGHHLAFLHAGAVVDQEIAYVAGLLGVDVDFLERHQLGGDRELALESLPAHLGNPDSDARRRVAFCAHFFTLGTAGQTAGQNRSEAANRPKKLEPAIRSFTQ